MNYLDYLKKNKKHLTQEELNNWIYFGGGSENDFRFFADILNWDILLETHQLSENFIRENIKYVDLKKVFMYQPVSKDFKREFHIEKYIDNYEEYEDMEEIRNFNKVLGQFEQLGRMFGHY